MSYSWWEKLLAIGLLLAPVLIYRGVMSHYFFQPTATLDEQLAAGKDTQAVLKSRRWSEEMQKAYTEKTKKLQHELEKWQRPLVSDEESLEVAQNILRKLMSRAELNPENLDARLEGSDVHVNLLLEGANDPIISFLEELARQEPAVKVEAMTLEGEGFAYDDWSEPLLRLSIGLSFSFTPVEPG